MIDIARHLQAVHREVSARPDASETVSVVLRRSYAAGPVDVWDALTDPERLRRWFLPITGDLRVGGGFQLEGNASGDILACEPPRLLRLTFGGPTSIVEIRLSADGADRTVFEMEHAVPLEMAGSGAGALWVGPGWDGALLGLGLFVEGLLPVGADPAAMANSIEVQQYCRASIDFWVAEIERSDTATAEQIAENRAIAIAQFSPDVLEPAPAE